MKKIVVESDGYPMLHSANDIRTLLTNAFIAGMAASPPAPAQERWKECARCLMKYPQETKGLSPCCEASLINVVDWPLPPSPQEPDQ